MHSLGPPLRQARIIEILKTLGKNVMCHRHRRGPEVNC